MMKLHKLKGGNILCFVTGLFVLYGLLFRVTDAGKLVLILMKSFVLIKFYYYLFS